MNFEKIIISVYDQIRKLENKGELASYIPELTTIDPDKFGIFISTVHQGTFGIGDYLDRFSIQSIGKVLSLTLAYKILGESIWNRLGVEPSGTSFNSLVQLEADKGIPRNPFINAGALVICDILISHLDDPKEEFLTFVRSISDNPNIIYSSKIAESEKAVGYRNIALCNFLKSFGNIHNDPSEVLDFYFDLCSLEMNCRELSEAFLFLAHNGVNPFDQTPIVTQSQSKRINALMQTCGFYDESGEFAFKVGLPGKSGVGGGIIAVHPNQYAIAVWSPLLNPKGNSYRGIRFLEEFTTKSQFSIF
ncbi:MAG TPA: glutaminase [Bacteroidales bacterium]|jgi:glutaminase|nr:glutaminase [Bacteroidales bacterium]HPE41294.1 glutaminase [Bacteroidales bacterium]